MISLDADNVVDYLIARGFPESREQYRVEPLAWGVSNTVIRVDLADHPSVVIKQSQRQLRTQVEWFSRLSRIYREADVINAIAPLLPSGAVPRVIFEDRDNYVFAMQAVHREHVVWKQVLLSGKVDLHIGQVLGEYLGTIHRQTTGSTKLRECMGDVTVFDELRLDPFYRHLTSQHAELAGVLEALVAETLATSQCLVLADFSPKNILLTPHGLSLVDFETGHFGDPAFDLGFFLSHLLLKALLHPQRREEFSRLITAFWECYARELQSGDAGGLVPDVELHRRSVAHLAGCILARIDGKSPVDYLSEPQREMARSLGKQLLLAPPATLPDAVQQWIERLPANG